MQELEDKGDIPPIPKQVKEAMTTEELAEKLTDGIYKMYSMDMLPACFVFPGGPGGMCCAYACAETYYHAPCCKGCFRYCFKCFMKPKFICHCRICSPWIVNPCSCFKRCCKMPEAPKGQLKCCKMGSCKTATCQFGTGEDAVCAMTFVKCIPCICCCQETGLMTIDKIIEGYEPVPQVEPWKTSFKLPAAPSNLVIGRVSEFADKIDEEAKKCICCKYVEPPKEEEPPKKEEPPKEEKPCSLTCCCYDVKAKLGVKKLEANVEKEKYTTPKKETSKKKDKSKPKSKSKDKVLPPNAAVTVTDVADIAQ